MEIAYNRWQITKGEPNRSNRRYDAYDVHDGCQYSCGKQHGMKTYFQNPLSWILHLLWKRNRMTSVNFFLRTRDVLTEVRSADSWRWLAKSGEPTWYLSNTSFKVRITRHGTLFFTQFITCKTRTLSVQVTFSLNCMFKYHLSMIIDQILCLYIIQNKSSPNY